MVFKWFLNCFKIVFKWFFNAFLNGLFGVLVVTSRTSSNIESQRFWRFNRGRVPLAALQIRVPLVELLRCFSLIVACFTSTSSTKTTNSKAPLLLIFPRFPGIKRPPLRFSAGAPGEKTRGLWDCGEIAISEISGFFMFFLIWKIAKIRGFKAPPPLDFPPKM